MRFALAIVIAVCAAVIAVRSNRSADHMESVIAPINPLHENGDAAGAVSVSLGNREAELFRALDSATNDAERRQVLVEHRDDHVLAQKLLAEAGSAPTPESSIAALAMVVSHFPHTSEGTAAAGLLLTEYINHASLECAFDELEKSESDRAIEILLTAYRSNPHGRVRGHAEFSVATLLKTRAERNGWRNPTGSWADTALAESLFEEIAAHYGSVRVSRGFLADLARSQLAEIHTVGVGKLAPEFQGEDTDGRPMQLSDYRGKVVVLAFWGNWCSLCRSMFPYERSLVERMRGRPFVLLGVNSDERSTVAQTLAEEKVVTWRSWRDGGEVHGGAIARQWNVEPLPDIFILDARGVIRHHVGPYSDDHGPVYRLDADGNLQHRWQARTDEVLEVAEALVAAVERERANAHVQPE